MICQLQVSVAHLKPVERRKPGQEPQINRSKAPAWSFGPTGTNTPLTLIQSSPSHGPLVKQAHMKCSHDTFGKEWRKLGEDLVAKATFLTRCEPHEFPEMFKVEIPPHLLAEILETVCTCFRAKERSCNHPEEKNILIEAFSREVDEEWVMAMLEALVKCGRFLLAVGLMGEKPRAVVKNLFHHLAKSKWYANPDAKAATENESRANEEATKSRNARLQQLSIIYSVTHDMIGL